jgi:hypothetical protein
VTTSQIDGRTIEDLVRGWPETARGVAQTVAEKYGPPDEATDSFLVWHERGPWKRTVLWRDEADHSFPTPHKDVLEQVIDYRVPPERADDIIAFDGSVVIERTRGELSARCEGEEANFLAVNLAHEIASGELDTEDARRAYTETFEAFKAGEQPEYMQRLVFDVPRGETRDEDSPTIDS